MAKSGNAVGDLPGPGSRHGAHMLEDVETGSFDVARHELGGLIGIACLDVGNEFAMIADDLRTPGESKIELPADRAEHLAMFPPQLRGVAIVVSLIDQGVKFGIKIAVLDLVGEVVELDLALNSF